MIVPTKFYIFATVIAIYAIFMYINENLYTKLPLYFDSDALDVRFQSVSDAFRQNFVDGWERGGAALAVYFRDEKVLDMWGGYADVQAARKWRKDTITVTFSCLKAVMALCVALLVDRNLLSYGDLITDHWPGFGKNGKSNITVQMLLSHAAGLAYLDETLNLKTAADHRAMRRIFENERPKWPPGQESGYHAYMFYWLIDQLIRHSDKQKRGVQQFFHDEIASRFGIDYSMGLSMKEEHRLARISTPSWSDLFSEIYQTPQLIWTLPVLFSMNKDSMVYKMVRNLGWLHSTASLQINNPNFHHLLHFGFGNARSLANIFHKLLTGKVLSPRTQQLLNEVYINSTDICLMERLAKGNGLIFFDINRAQVTHAYGHSGSGCQQIIHDVRNDLTIAYVTNAMKFGVYDRCRTYIRLQKAIYDVVEKLRK